MGVAGSLAENLELSNYLSEIGHNKFSIAQLGVLREQNTYIYKAACNTTWVEGLL